jgi:hypothetical protein
LSDQLKDVVALIWLFSSATAIANCCMRLENRAIAHRNELKTTRPYSTPQLPKFNLLATSQ